MSVGDVQHTMSRIRAATVESPLAVFKSRKYRGEFDSLLAGTYATQQRMKTDESFLGLFWNNPNQSLDEIREALSKC